MKIKINVTQTDIDNGKPYVCTAAPEVLALKRRVNCFVKVHPGKGPKNSYENLRIQLGDLDLPAPPSLKSFSKRFDMGVYVEPFSFTIDVPKKYVKVGTGGK